MIGCAPAEFEIRLRQTLYSEGGMRPKQLSRAVQRETKLAPAAARDQVDELVHEILRRLRQGEPVDLPGLGKLIQAPKAIHRDPQ